MMIRRIFILLICILVMIATNASAETAATSVKASLQKNEIYIGENTRIIVTVSPWSVSDSELEYSSDNSDVAIAGIGVVVGKSAGYANITVTVKGTSISDTVRIKVTEKEVNIR